ncbi:hypothetical protein EDC04DRAFT_110640 [Pisolithus marmoratus]|nr:hypothetical protein EDC04DRAFT_110640 [Pisolithus marmoratus]
MESQLRGKASVGTPQENGIRAHPSDAPFNPHCAPLLPETRKILDEWSFYEPQRMQNGVKLISQTLGVGLLERIYTFFLNVLEDNQRTGQVDHTDTNMPDARSIVQEIGGLQAILEVAEDEDAQRALEEDITGKILWFYWCGICVEVDQLLPKACQVSSPWMLLHVV